MSPSTTTALFLREFVNNSPEVKSTRIDKMLKAIINNLRARKEEDIIEYLNRIRIIYFFKRCKYYNYDKFREILGMYISSIYTNYTNNI